MRIFYSIKSVTPAPGFMLEIEYRDGETIEVDLKPLLAQGGVFDPLKDPVAFAEATVGEKGRFIEWPNGVDLCADALRQKGARISPTSGRRS